MPSSGFGEEGEQEIKESVKPATSNSYTWEELAKYNERQNAHVAVRGKVSLIILRLSFVCVPYCIDILSMLIAQGLVVSWS